MKIEMITGPMFSGKSEELIRRIRRQVFTPSIDFRGGNNYIFSHDKRKIEAMPVSSSKEILEKLDPDTEVVGIDEIQFLDDGMIDVAEELVRRGIRVILACLNLDFRGEPFPFKNSKRTVAEMIARSDYIDKLQAICTHKIKDGNGNVKICGRKAQFTQRLINGEPAPYDSPTIVVGSEELYEARCREHHIVPGKPRNKHKDV
jgi:thymidine kinase